MKPTHVLYVSISIRTTLSHHVLSVRICSQQESFSHQNNGAGSHFMTLEIVAETDKHLSDMQQSNASLFCDASKN